MAEGEILTLRDTAGGADIAITASTLAWNKVVRADPNYTVSSNGQSITISEAGRYLLLLSVAVETNRASDETSVRVTMMVDGAGVGGTFGYANLNGAASARSQTAFVAQIVQLDAADVVTIQLILDQSTNPSGGEWVRTKAGSSVQLIRLPDSWDYARLRSAANQSVGTGTTWTGVTWNTQDEVETGTFAHSTSTNPSQIEVKTTGKYLICAVVTIREASTGVDLRSMQNQVRLVFDGSELPGARVGFFISDSGGCEYNSGCIFWYGELAGGTGKILEVQVRKFVGVTSSNVRVNQNRNGFAIAKVPDAADSIILMDDSWSGSPQAADATTDLLWREEIEKDSASFTHAVDDDTIEVEKDGTYLFGANVYIDRSGTDADELIHRMVWRNHANSTDFPIGVGAIVDVGQPASINYVGCGCAAGMIVDAAANDQFGLRHYSDSQGATDTTCDFKNQDAGLPTGYSPIRAWAIRLESNWYSGGLPKMVRARTIGAGVPRTNLAVSRAVTTRSPSAATARSILAVSRQVIARIVDGAIPRLAVAITRPIALRSVLSGMSRVAVVASGPQTFTAIADARVNEANPTSNAGSDISMRVREAVGGSYHSYVRFDLSSIIGTIVSATLRLWCTDGSNVGGVVYPTNGTWAEGTITWNNAPGSTGASIASLGSVSTNTWAEWDVTSAVTADEINFVLKSTSSDSCFFDTREGTNPPELVVEVSGGGGTVAIAGRAIGMAFARLALKVDRVVKARSLASAITRTSLRISRVTQLRSIGSAIGRLGVARQIAHVARSHGIALARAQVARNVNLSSRSNAITTSRFGIRVTRPVQMRSVATGTTKLAVSVLTGLQLSARSLGYSIVRTALRVSRPIKARSVSSATNQLTVNVLTGLQIAVRSFGYSVARAGVRVLRSAGVRSHGSAVARTRVAVTRPIRGRSIGHATPKLALRMNRAVRTRALGVAAALTELTVNRGATMRVVGNATTRTAVRRLTAVRVRSISGAVDRLRLAISRPLKIRTFGQSAARNRITLTSPTDIPIAGRSWSMSFARLALSIQVAPCVITDTEIDLEMLLEIKSILEELGGPVTITDHQSVYNVATRSITTNPIPTTVLATPPEPYRYGYEPNSVIQDGDLRVYIQGDGFVPKTGMSLELSGETGSVVAVTAWYSGNRIALYEIAVRGITTLTPIAPTTEIEQELYDEVLEIIEELGRKAHFEVAHEIGYSTDSRTAGTAAPTTYCVNITPPQEIKEFLSGRVVLTGKLRTAVPMKNLPFVPKLNQVVVLDGVRYNILAVRPRSIGTVPVLAELDLGG